MVTGFLNAFGMIGLSGDIRGWKNAEASVSNAERTLAVLSSLSSGKYAVIASAVKIFFATVRIAPGRNCIFEFSNL